MELQIKVTIVLAFLFFKLLYSSFGVISFCLDSVLKSRDITLLTKVHVVKDLVFPVVMYGFESWTIKKAERQRTDAFKLFSSVQSLSHV